MYKSVDIRDGSDVVILDPKWLRAIESLRVLDHQDFLVCQGCNQPVRVRAGVERRPHFAHKHLLNCNYTDESPALRNARAVLYEWLVSKFGEKVTIEKRIASEEFFRPVDCWIEKDSKIFAYWIFDATLKPEKRHLLQNGFAKLDVCVNWIFVQQMLRTETNYPENLILTTTEREFAVRSEYDEIAEKGFSIGKTLHYLDADAHQITTLRGLRLFHEPQVYQGCRFASNLEQVLVSPKTGEFVHAGEYERLKQHRAEQAALEKRRKEMEEKRSRNQLYQKPRAPFQRPIVPAPVFPIIQEQNTDLTVAPDILPSLKDDTAKPVVSYYLPQQEGVCIFCGEITTDWWSYDGKTGQCKCRSCSKKGKF